MEPRAAIRTPDRRLRVFVSSTLGELAAERRAVRDAVEAMHLAPVLFELGARPTRHASCTEPRVAAARGGLTPDVLQQHWEAGRRLDPFSLLDETLAALSSSGSTGGPSHDRRTPSAAPAVDESGPLR